MSFKVKPLETLINNDNRTKRLDYNGGEADLILYGNWTKRLDSSGGEGDFILYDNWTKRLDYSSGGEGDLILYDNRIKRLDYSGGEGDFTLYDNRTKRLDYSGGEGDLILYDNLTKRLNHSGGEGDLILYDNLTKRLDYSGGEGDFILYDNRIKRLDYSSGEGDLILYDNRIKRLDYSGGIFRGWGCGVVGSGIVRSLLEEGASVVVNSRTASRLDDLHNSIPGKLQRRLTTIQEDCGVEDAVRRTKDFIIKEFGRVDHVVTSLGSFWQKGVLTDQSPGGVSGRKYITARGHISLVSKVFLPYLSERPGSSFTYITGSGGEKCFDPKISLLTVKAACLFGVVEAARAQCRGGNVAVIEIRIATFVQPADDSTFKSQSTVVGHRLHGESLHVNHQAPPFRVRPCDVT
ncbi:uncharacterized protein LOC135480372 [Liolophura sinensis]|uniref:uncharacterized protein LOC135480372 n=1 Tax=Liolophura sinensis TaxID=3198878 RepID=UPI0031584BDA